MPRKPPTAAKSPRAPRKRTPAAPPPPASRASALIAIVLICLAAVAYRFRDPQITPGQDTQLARAAVRQHSALMISEIIEPVRQANTGQLTAEQVLAIIKTAHPVIDRHTWSPLADRITQLQLPDSGQMDQQRLAKFLDEVESGFRE